MSRSFGGRGGRRPAGSREVANNLSRTEASASDTASDTGKAGWGALNKADVSRTWTTERESKHAPASAASAGASVTMHTARHPEQKAGTATHGNRSNIDGLDAHFLHDHGFLVLPAFFSPAQIATARQTMNDGLARVGGPPKSKEAAGAWVKEKSAMQNHPSLLQLVHESPLSRVLQFLFPQGIQQLVSCQIAFRFPGERAEESGEPWYSDWHIDNFVSDYSYQPSEFNFLLGIYFTANESDYEGNFTVFPGTHYRVEQFARRRGGRAFFLQNKLKDLRSELDLNKPWQVQAPEGSVIIAHRMLPHTIAPNRSSKTREVVWYRVKLKDLQPDNDMLHMWRAWPKLRQMLDLKPDLLDSSVSASSSSSSTSTAATSDSPLAAWHQQLTQIESAGLGELVTYDDQQIHFRVRPSRGDPGRFASMVSVYLDRSPPYKFTFHTNGFIARDKHSLMVQTLVEDLGGLPPIPDLFAIARWIGQCDFLALIERWYPLPTADELKSSPGVACRRWDLHHLHSRSKSAFMQRWGEQLELKANIQRGEPGCVEVSGPRRAVEVFTERFSCFHWKHCVLSKS